MGDLECQNNSREKEGQPDDEERVRAEMRHLVDDAPHAQTLYDLTRSFPVEESDAADVREVREDKAPHHLKDALHGFPPLVMIIKTCSCGSSRPFHHAVRGPPSPLRRGRL